MRGVHQSGRPSPKKERRQFRGAFAGVRRCLERRIDATRIEREREAPRHEGEMGEEPKLRQRRDRAQNSLDDHENSDEAQNHRRHIEDAFSGRRHAASL